MDLEGLEQVDLDESLSSIFHALSQSSDYIASEPTFHTFLASLHLPTPQNDTPALAHDLWGTCCGLTREGMHYKAFLRALRLLAAKLFPADPPPTAYRYFLQQHVFEYGFADRGLRLDACGDVDGVRQLLDCFRKPLKRVNEYFAALDEPEGPVPWEEVLQMDSEVSFAEFLVFATDAGFYPQLVTKVQVKKAYDQAVAWQQNGDHGDDEDDNEKKDGDTSAAHGGDSEAD
jgi:hypothetical protein